MKDEKKTLLIHPSSFIPHPFGCWVASIEPSRFVEGRAYVAFDAHRSDDDAPYVYVTEDYGQSWRSLSGGLPAGSTRVLREDVENPNLLYLGTEFGFWVSLNRGGSWTKANNNLPTVAIHEVAVHRTAGEVVVATHGRSLWVLDVTALRQMMPEVLREKAHLFAPHTAMRWHSEPPRDVPMGAGSRHFVGQNPPSGAQLTYALTSKAERIGLKVQDYTGHTVREWSAKEGPHREAALATEPGLHVVSWDLLGVPASKEDRDARKKEGEKEGDREGRRPGARRDQPLQPMAGGTYRVVLTVNGEEQTQWLRLEVDPLAPKTTTTAEDEEEEEKEAPRLRD